jgi:hypothetical protein
LPVHILYRVLTDDRFTGQVVAAEGYLHSRSEFMVDADGQVNALVNLSRDFKAGDILHVTVALLIKYQYEGIERIIVSSHPIGPRYIQDLPYPRQLVANRENSFFMNETCCILPSDYAA